MMQNTPPTPAEQAQIAVRIGELEALLPQMESWILQLSGRRANAWRKRTREGIDDEILAGNQHLQEVRVEANTLRARIGLPLVVESSRQAGPAPTKAAAKGGGCLVSAVLVIGLVLCALFVSGSGTSYRSALPSGKATRNVNYYVSGTDTKRASLTIENAQGGSEQHEVTLPWHLSFEAPSGQFLYLSAQNENEFGSIDCGIVADGETVQRASSNGGSTIATCSGRVP